MANKKHLARLIQGVGAWNEWRAKKSHKRPDLSGANLSGRNLSGFNLANANLTNVILDDACLDNANLQEADLTQAGCNRSSFVNANMNGVILRNTNLNKTELWDADLRGANIEGVSLQDADLTDAKLDMLDFRNARLSEADFEEASLIGANFSGIRMWSVNFHGADLRRAILRNTDLMWADLTKARLHYADLSGAVLNHALLIETDFENANLSGCSVYGVAAWGVKLEGATQTGLVITPEGESTVTVDDLEVAQFIYLLLNHQKLRNIINAITDRGVLILGRFSEGGIEVLQAIAAKLREMKYLPIIFDFDRPTGRNLTETIKTLVGISRFVIADLSGPSVPHELASTVPHFKIPFVPIMQRGRNPYAMFVDLLENDYVLKPIVEFETIDQLLGLMPTEIIAPAEEKHAERQETLNRLFPPR